LDIDQKFLAFFGKSSPLLVSQAGYGPDEAFNQGGDKPDNQSLPRNFYALFWIWKMSWWSMFHVRHT